MRLFLMVFITSMFILSCKSTNDRKPKKFVKNQEIQQIASVRDILAKKEVPILCYHQIRDFLVTDSKRAKDYIVPVSNFKEQMKMLHDSGYVSILPDQLLGYLKYGHNIPKKAVMISFDDTDDDQFQVAKPILDEYGFKAVFFIMTVSLNKKGYMTTKQVRQLSEEGHIIGSHTWDHMNVKKMNENDWLIEIDKPKFQLEEITGKKIKYFAYPFGIWSPDVFEGLRKRNVVAAFQLSAKRDQNEPLMSIRRIIIPGEWGKNTVMRVIKNSFH